MINLYKCLFAAVVLTMPALGAAASVELSVSPSPYVVGLNQTFDLVIMADYDADASERLVGGAINLSGLDTSVLQINSVIVETPQDFGVSTGAIDNSAGGVDTIGFATFAGVEEGSFKYATVNFESVGLGTSPIGLEDAKDGIYAWAREGGSLVPFSAIGGSVTVVPIPAAAYLLATGLVGLIGVSRRRKLS